LEIPLEVRNEILDQEHLRLLAIGHYITGGLSIAFSSIFIFHFVFFLLATNNPEVFNGPGQTAQSPPTTMMSVFAIMIGLVIVAGWTFGGLTIYAGRCINRRAGRLLTLVLAGLNTMFVPFGTILGVCTLLVLNRPSVKRLYAIPNSGFRGR
jgi:hypothetical protein